MSMESLGINDVRKQMCKYGVFQYDCPSATDKGIDAYYEIVENNRQIGILFCGQIKSGKSYIRGSNCYVYDEEAKHIDMWKNMNIPFFLFVYDPVEDQSYWLDAQKYILDNSVNYKKGFTFIFPKEGNELNETGIKEIKRLVNMKYQKIQSPIDRAIYNFYLFEDISKLYENEANGENRKSITSISEWLDSKGLKYNKRFTDTLIESIKDYCNGLGIVGSLMREDEINRIDIFENQPLLLYMENGVRSMEHDIKYDFDKCLTYFKQYVVSVSSIYEIAKMKDMEIILCTSPYVSPRVIQIHKVGKLPKLYELNRTRQIDLECNKYIEEAILSKKNIFIVGGAFSQKGKIISAISSLFKANENIVVIEDRREIKLWNNDTQYLVSNSQNRLDVINILNRGVNLESDRLILNIGNFQRGLDSIVLLVFNIFNNRKGCIVAYNYKISFLNEHILKALEALIYRETSGKIFVNEFFKNVDVIIVTDDFNDLGYIQNIWIQDQNTWEKVFSFSDNIYEIFGKPND